MNYGVHKTLYICLQIISHGHYWFILETIIWGGNNKLHQICIGKLLYVPRVVPPSMKTNITCLASFLLLLFRWHAKITNSFYNFILRLATTEYERLMPTFPALRVCPGHYITFYFVPRTFVYSFQHLRFRLRRVTGISSFNATQQKQWNTNKSQTRYENVLDYKAKNARLPTTNNEK